MRRCSAKDRQQARRRGFCLLAVLVLTAGVLSLNRYAVPFGSLTNNSLMSGLGPGWLLSIRPKGYVQGEIRETTQSLSINTTRYSAVLQLSVTVNMILDGSTATLTVAADYPLASLLVCGDIPNAYASDLD